MVFPHVNCKQLTVKAFDILHQPSSILQLEYWLSCGTKHCVSHCDWVDQGLRVDCNSWAMLKITSVYQTLPFTWLAIEVTDCKNLSTWNLNRRNKKNDCPVLRSTSKCFEFIWRENFNQGGLLACKTKKMLQ